MKICLDFGFIEGFWKMPTGFGWPTREERHTRVMPKWDEDGSRKMGIHCLVRTSINRSVVYLRVSNELWKWEFSKIELGQNERNWQREFPKFQMFLGSGVLWVSDLITLSFKFWCLLNCAPSYWHGHQWLLTEKH